MQINQNECDHIIGIDCEPEPYYNRWFFMSNKKRLKYLDRKFSFKHCPKCGAKIDWQKIEENLNANNS